MINLARLFRDYNQTASLNEHLNLYGFISDHAFLTKSGDIGVVLSISGVDYECLDQSNTDTIVQRLQVAQKLFDDQYRIYQYLFKRSNRKIPFRLYKKPILDEAIRNRMAFFEAKAGELYSHEIFYVILFEGFRHQKASLLSALWKPRAAAQIILDSLSHRWQVRLLEAEIDAALNLLMHRTEGFISHLSDLCEVRMLQKGEAFRFLRSLVNFAQHKIEYARLKHDTFLDYYVPDSALECHRGHLLVDDYVVRVLSLKEPSSQSFPLIFKALLEVQADFHITTEWHPVPSNTFQRKIQSKRRHFHNSKTSILSQVGTTENSPQTDLLVDDSKESLVKELGESKKELEIQGNFFGEFSLTIVIYDKQPQRIDKAISEFSKIFSTFDAALYDERFNLLNAFLATVPGNYFLNLRRMYILNTNYADYSFFFTLSQGDEENRHLGTEYLAVLESNQQTPYYLNLHHQDIAHTIILGKTGAGKSFLLNFLITFLQKYSPFTFIFDMGGSYRKLVDQFGGSYLQVGIESRSFIINPFALAQTRENQNFLFNFFSLLIEAGGTRQLTHKEERDLYEQIDMVYSIEPRLRTLSTFANTLSGPLRESLHKWTREGPYGFLFDNAEDTLQFARFQCIEFEGMKKYPQLIEPLLFYLLHRASAVIHAEEQLSTFKAFVIDEAWTFLNNPVVKAYIIEALKTWRKKNAGMILATQSVDELKKSAILDIVLEACSTKIFLANPDMDRALYQETFHLNDRETALVTELIPKRQMLIKRPDFTKVVNLNVDLQSYWLYTSDPMDNVRLSREKTNSISNKETLQ